MAYIDQATLAVDATFQSRVQIAAITAALAIANEARDAEPGDDMVYEKRESLAVNTLESGGGTYTSLAWAIVADPTITADSTDDDILAAVNAVWSAVATVRATD